MVSPTRLRAVDLIHSDDNFNRAEVAPSISVSTTFKAPNPTDPSYHPEEKLDFRNPQRHVYARYTQDTSGRVETILSKVLDGFAITYASGLASAYAALMFYQPKRIAIRGGYHGCHASIEVYRKTRTEVQVIDIDDAFLDGDLCWIETPLNPTGESRDIKYYADKVHAVGGRLLVDSTFGPPPLQYPFKFGTDCIMHSATKYLGGHSDMLGGVLVVKTRQEWDALMSDRTFLGNMMGSLESWLLLRSLRTLHLRVPRQSETATALAQWLAKAAAAPEGQPFDGVPTGIIEKVWHSSLQGRDERGFEPKTQMEGGWCACFAIMLASPEHASALPYAVKYFVPATSLGGVESLMEQRVRSDPGADPRVVRLSVGVEDLDDLRDDLRSAFQDIAKGKTRSL